MSFTSYEESVSNPTETGHAVLSSRSNSNFMVAPMSAGHSARLVEKVEEEDESPVSGIGVSILGSVIGSALGFGPMFDFAFEAVKTGIEFGEGRGAIVSYVQDVNLNPAAILRPDLAFNFKSFHPNPTPTYLKPKDEDEKPKRTWSSGEGDFLLASRLAAKRNGNGSVNSIGSRGLSPFSKESRSGK